MYKIVYNDELSHHGITGQKWGHRNGPPYPLGASDHSAAEKAAMSSKSGPSSKSVSSGSDSKSSKSSSSDDIATGKNFVANQKKEGWSDLSSDEQAVLIELGVVTTAVAVSATASKIYEVKERKRLDKKLNEMREKGDFKTLADVPRFPKGAELDTEKNMLTVNPGFPDEGTTNNCMLCTTAMIMREKGYNVNANKIDEGLFEKNVEKAFDGPNVKFKKLRVNDTDQIYDKLAKEGDGAYGNLTVQFWLGGGHSVFWKVENGEARIYDGQSGEEYKRDGKGDYGNMMLYVNPKFCQYSRCDNAEPTDYVLSMITKSGVEIVDMENLDD